MTAGNTIWKRQGMLLPVKEAHGWWTSHAQAPTLLALSPELWRIYFAGRNADNQASVLAVDVDPQDRMRVVAEHYEPMLEPGPTGTFDCAGLGPSCALIIGGRVHLYYTGFVQRRDVRFHLSIGLAVSDDGLHFTRAFVGPVRSTGPLDPYFVSTACVRPERDGYRMWYVSGTGWRDMGDGLEPIYEIRSCHSADGLIWESASICVLHDTLPQEAGLGRPWVTEISGDARLWYSRRGLSFRGAGEGAYRLASRRLDASGTANGEVEPVVFDPPPREGEFDGWMQAYCCLTAWEDTQVMFYNGDDFGRHGIGWAIRHDIGQK